MSKDKSSNISSRKPISFSERMADVPKYEPFVPPKGAVPIDWSAIDKPPGKNFYMDVINGYWIPNEEETVVENVSNKVTDEENEVHQGQWYTIAPAAPNNAVSTKEQTVAKPKIERQTRKSKKTDTPPSFELTPDSKLEKVEPTSAPQPEAVEQSKKTRRSAKMDEADFDTLTAAFIFPTDLAEKKPLFFPEKIRESLRRIAGLIPGGKVSPSHVAIHIVNAWLDEHRDLLNRVLASQKTSI